MFCCDIPGSCLSGSASENTLSRIRCSSQSSSSQTPSPKMHSSPSFTFGCPPPRNHTQHNSTYTSGRGGNKTLGPVRGKLTSQPSSWLVFSITSSLVLLCTSLFLSQPHLFCLSVSPPLAAILFFLPLLISRTVDGWQCGSFRMPD